MYSKRPVSNANVPAGWGSGRSRISWGAILAGALTAVATSLLLSLLGAGLGAGWIQPSTLWSNLAGLSTGAVLWSILNLGLSMLVGGYVAARLSGTQSHQDAELHGFTTWALATLLGTALAAWLLGGLAGILGQGMGSLINRTAGDAVGTATRLIAPEADMKSLGDRLRQSLGQSEDVTAMSREQIAGEINSLVQRSLTTELPSQDLARLVALVAAESGMTRDEASRRVARLVEEVKTNRELIANRARVAGETVAQGAATAARGLFAALTTGLLGSLIGAWLGTHHKRSLLPQLEGRDGYGSGTYEQAAAYGERAYSGRREAARARHGDDASRHLASQYLRDIAFPASKQELLRLARARSSDPGLLHAIESLPERRYADLVEVLEAIDMAHAS